MRIARSYTTKPLKTGFLEALASANIRFSFTRDLRMDLNLPENRGARTAAQKFSRLFGDDPRIVHREIVNWNLAEDPEPGPHFLPDDQTSVHAVFLFDNEGTRFMPNLCCPLTADYLGKPQSRLYRFLEGRDLAAISFHLCDACETTRLDYDLGISYPECAILDQNEVFLRFIDALEALNSNLPTSAGFPILLENMDYKTPAGSGACSYEHVTQPSFIASILKRSGCSFLFDIGHAMVTANNVAARGGSVKYAEDLIDLIGIERFRELHIALPVKEDEGVWIDCHRPLSSALDSPEALELLSVVKLIITERHRAGNPSPLTVNFEAADKASVHRDAEVMATFFRMVLGF
ncbi:MAG: DUF692 family multinuclear iron-containing protein [Candidatus Margulisiibacteriota bacterium]